MIFPQVTDQEIAAIKRMDRTQFDELKRRILQASPNSIFGEAKTPKNGIEYIICPQCGNGSGKDATPVDVHFKGDKWLYCCQKGCGFEGDLLSIIAKEENLNLADRNDFCKALAIGSNLVGENLYLDCNIPAQNSHDDDKKEQLPLIHDDISSAQNSLHLLPDNQRRGLSIGTLQHFNCGFLQKWIHPQFRVPDYNDYVPPPSRRIIIPTANHYNAVALDADREATKKQYHKQHAGKMELFNPDALNSDFVILVEGEFDAASIWQALGGKVAVAAVLGVKNWQKTLIPLIKNLPPKKFLILFDHDDAGKVAAPILQSKLSMLGHRAAVRFLYDTLLERYVNPDNNKSHRSLNIFCICAVFLLYAEDSGLFTKSQFYDYLKPRSRP